MRVVPAPAAGAGGGAPGTGVTAGGAGTGAAAGTVTGTDKIEPSGRTSQRPRHLRPKICA